MKKISWHTLTLASLSLFLSSHSFASQVVPQWYDGWWDCLIDGRASQIVWETKVVPYTTCDGDICTSSDRVETNGWFRELNADWFRLVKNSSTASNIQFTYTGDNTRWFLAYNAQTRSAVGHTTWNGQRYPLSCRKM